MKGKRVDGSTWLRRTQVIEDTNDRPIELYTIWIRLSPTRKTREKWTVGSYIEDIPKTLQGERASKFDSRRFGKDAVGYTIRYWGRTAIFNKAEFGSYLLCDYEVVPPPPSFTVALNMAKEDRHHKTQGLMIEC